MLRDKLKGLVYGRLGLTVPSPCSDIREVVIPPNNMMFLTPPPMPTRVHPETQELAMLQANAKLNKAIELVAEALIELEIARANAVER